MRDPALRLRTLVAVGALAFGVLVRVVLWWRNRPLWLDEQLIGFNLRGRDFAGLLHGLDNQQSAPVGWLWLERLMVVTFGAGELALRFVPLLLGIATVVVAFLLGRAYLGPVGSAALILFTATNISMIGYSAQVKHYTADSLFGLALLALAFWLLRGPGSLRRWGVWWVSAAVGSLLSNGAFLVVPGLFLVLVVVAWREVGARRALFASGLGLVWLAAFAVDYAFAVGPTAAGNEYLYGFWSAGFPPADPRGFLPWLARCLLKMAENPLYLGTGIGAGRLVSWLAAIPFWLLVAAGIVVAYRRRPAVGLLLAAPMVSAILLATLHVVPLLARLTLWAVPSLFVAVGFALDAAARVVANRLRPAGDGEAGGSVAVSRWSLPRGVVLSAAVLALSTLLVFVAYVPAAWRDATSPLDHDDRAGVAYLREIHRPGDLVLAVGNGGYGMRWYDPDGTLSPWRTVLSTKDEQCPEGFVEAVRGFQRVLVYSGARIPPWDTTPEPTRDKLATMGRLVQTQQLTGASVVWVFDLTMAPDPAARAPQDCVYLV